MLIFADVREAFLDVQERSGSDLVHAQVHVTRSANIGNHIVIAILVISDMIRDMMHMRCKAYLCCYECQSFFFSLSSPCHTHTIPSLTVKFSLRPNSTMCSYVFL